MLFDFDRLGLCHQRNNTCHQRNKDSRKNKLFLFFDSWFYGIVPVGVEDFADDAEAFHFLWRDLDSGRVFFSVFAATNLQTVFARRR